MANHCGGVASFFTFVHQDEKWAYEGEKIKTSLLLEMAYLEVSHSGQLHWS